MIITLIIGLVTGLFVIIIKVLDNSAKKWNRAIGTITRSELIEKISEDTDGRKSITYKVDLEYSYSKNGEGKEMVGNQLFPYVEAWSPFKQEKIKIQEKLPQGTKVEVFYKPGNSSMSCLIAGANYFPYYFISAGLFFVAIAVVIWIYDLSDDLTLVLDQIIAK